MKKQRDLMILNKMDIVASYIVDWLIEITGMQQLIRYMVGQWRGCVCNDGRAVLEGLCL